MIQSIDLSRNNSAAAAKNQAACTGARHGAFLNIERNYLLSPTKLLLAYNTGQFENGMGRCHRATQLMMLSRPIGQACLYVALCYLYRKSARLVTSDHGQLLLRPILSYHVVYI